MFCFIGVANDNVYLMSLSFLKALYCDTRNSDAQIILETIVASMTLHKKMEFSIKDFLSKCDQIRRKLKIWSHLLKKSLIENFIFCAVWLYQFIDA